MPYGGELLDRLIELDRFVGEEFFGRLRGVAKWRQFSGKVSVSLKAENIYGASSPI